MNYNPQNPIIVQGDKSVLLGGSGVIVLPCGAGKTVVGMGVMAEMQCNTLILTPNTVAVRQWIDELVAKTTLTEDEVGEYTGQRLWRPAGRFRESGRQVG